MRRNRFPSGWNEARVRRVLEHYDRQTEEEAVAEDEAAFRRRDQTVMVVRKPLVPAITRLIERGGRPGKQDHAGLTGRCSRRRTNRAAAERQGR